MRKLFLAFIVLVVLLAACSMPSGPALKPGLNPPSWIQGTWEGAYAPHDGKLISWTFVPDNILAYNLMDANYDFDFNLMVSLNEGIVAANDSAVSSSYYSFILNYFDGDYEYTFTRTSATSFVSSIYKDSVILSENYAFERVGGR